MSDQVHGEGYFESKVETDAAALELEMDTIALKLKTETDVSQEISNKERYSADLQWSMLKLLLMGQHQYKSFSTEPF
jgi:hypothetical protein